MKKLFFIPLVLFINCCKECIETPVKAVDSVFYLSPELLKYKVGDTIYFTSEVSKSNLFTGDYSKIQDVELVSQITCAELVLDSFPYQFPGAKYFNHIIFDGEQNPISHKDSVELLDKNIVHFIFKNEKDRYFAKLGIIAIKPGVFAFSPFSLGIISNKNEKCRDERITRMIYANGNNNNEIYDNILKINSDINNYRNRYTLIVEPK